MGAKAKPDPGVVSLGGSLIHERKPDFSGYATRAGVKCSDGRTIMPDAFKHQDKTTVPLVWQHSHNDPSNVLGHAVLEHRDDGVYTYGYFNDSAQASNAKLLVQHDDIKHLSIYANQLVEKATQVLHGMIREVSLVMAGANPGAFIDNVSVQHSDGEIVTLSDEVVIYTDTDLTHSDDDQQEKKEDEKKDPDEVKHSVSDPTLQEVYDGMSDDEKAVVHYMVSAALEEAQATAAAAHSDKSIEDKKKEGTWMSRNVFEQQANGDNKPQRHVLSHDAIKGIVEDAQRVGSLKQAVEDYALKHGINSIDLLFPDAKSLDATPEFDKRRTEWVAGVMNSTRHSPFSRIKSLVADITFDEARARGYIKGHLKKEEFFGLTRRVTTPSTIYKKQKLDRDDIIDITDFDVVMWLKGEMRLMLEEELARAILIGDGRQISDEDKIKDPAGATEGAGIRSILNDDDLYAATITVPSSSTAVDISDNIVENMRFYKGSGSPTLYTTLPNLTKMLLARDTQGRRLYRNQAELADELGVANIVTVEVMESDPTLIGIIVNLSDYTIGADKGGDISFFDDFDIDYNQYKYLLETRLSGALTKIRSALVIKYGAAGATKVVPVKPGYVDATRVITPATTTGVTYKRADTDATVTTGSPITLTVGQTLRIYAVPASSSYFFEDNITDEWTFTGK